MSNDELITNEESFDTKQKNVFTPAPKMKRLIAGVLDIVFITIITQVFQAMIGFVVSPENVTLILLSSIFVSLILTVIYWVYIPLNFTATPGKKIFGLEIINFETKGKPTFGSMLLREIIGRTISGVVLLIGYFVILFRDDQRGWHDNIGNTVVVERN